MRRRLPARFVRWPKLAVSWLVVFVPSTPVEARTGGGAFALGMASHIQGQQCLPVQHVDEQVTPVFTPQEYVDVEDDWHFAEDFHLLGFEDRVAVLHSGFFVQSYFQFSEQSLSRLPDPNPPYDVEGLRIHSETPAGPRIEMIPDAVRISLDVVGQGENSLVGMYSNRRMPPPDFFFAWLDVIPTCDEGRCEVSFGLLDELHQYRWGYRISADTQDSMVHIWHVDGPTGDAADIIWSQHHPQVITSPGLGDRLRFSFEYDKSWQRIIFGILNQDNGLSVYEPVTGVTIDRSFYPVMMASVGSPL
ncbi:hypothetical protein ACFL51_01445, partial [Myxococcota bacterium]